MRGLYGTAYVIQTFLACSGSLARCDACTLIDLEEEEIGINWTDPTHVRRGTATTNRASYSPHLLKLYADLVESFGNHGNENVLHQPSEEEYHSTIST
jgi:hypothetical protein